MNLLALMYHRARAGEGGNAPAMLDAHFKHIDDCFSCVLPGERLETARLNVCLTFDGGYYDFYAVVFPLLKQHGLRALLAIPPLVVQSHTDAPADVRLSCEPEVPFTHPNRGGFCTWTELREMAHSGHVAIAAHGFTHCRLDAPDADLHSEITVAQHLLEAHLDQPVTSFVFPYGRFTRSALERVHETYQHAVGIGGADNPRGWGNQVIYRVDADRLDAPDAPFTPARRARYRARYFWNRLRGR